MSNKTKNRLKPDDASITRPSSTRMQTGAQAGSGRQQQQGGQPGGGKQQQQEDSRKGPKPQDGNNDIQERMPGRDEADDGDHRRRVNVGQDEDGK